MSLIKLNKLNLDQKPRNLHLKSLEMNFMLRIQQISKLVLNFANFAQLIFSSNYL